jgi:hypothetical protein
MSREPEPRAPRRPARRAVNWQHAAELLAQGVTVADTAARVGCSRNALARKRAHDATFRSWIGAAGEGAGNAQARRFDELRPTMHKVITREVGSGNVRVILWLADRLKLVTPPSQDTPEQELRQLLAGLTLEELREFESLRDESEGP